MTRRAGFTLIELVVIIMILGILAGVAAPKLLKTSSTATENGLKQTLSIVRDAIELYASETGGQLPACTAPGDNFKTSLKKYIRGTFPKCPVGNTNDQIAVSTASGTTTVGGTEGWRYNTADGTFIANTTATASTGDAYSSF